MKTEEKLKKIEDTLARAESHCEDMRLSLALAEAQVECLKREHKGLTVSP
jgi:hypothetical protein